MDGEKPRRRRIRNGASRSSTAKEIFVELATPQGRFFSGAVSAVEFSPTNGVVQMERGQVAYFSLFDAGEIIIRSKKRSRCFIALRGSASVQVDRLSVIAEVIESASLPVRNCANAECRCGDDEGLCGQ